MLKDSFDVISFNCIPVFFFFSLDELYLVKFNKAELVLEKLFFFWGVKVLAKLGKQWRGGGKWVVFSSSFLFLFFIYSFNLWRSFLMIVLCLQTKMSIGYWCRRELNFRSFLHSYVALNVKSFIFVFFL